MCIIEVLFGKPPHIEINDAIIDKTIYNQLDIMVSYVDIVDLCETAGELSQP